MGLALAIAACLHAFVILGVAFELEPAKRPERARQSLEVVVVHHPKQPPEEEVEHPDFFAQTRQQGSGASEKIARPQTKSLARPVADPQPRAAREHLQAAIPAPPSQPERRVLTQRSSDSRAPDARPEAAPKRRINAAQILASRNQEIAQLTAELAERSSAYAKRPKRKAISASTTEYKYAAYMEAWRRKVERIGNLNYPDEAKRNKLHGNLVLHVAVRSDGSIEQVRLLHSSGHKVLDDAAVRIVRLAAPFAPFPKDIREETDVLDITRTWQFLSSNALGWK